MSASESLVRNAVSQASTYDVPAFKSALKDLLPGLAALLLAFPLAFAIFLINRALPGQPEKAVEVTGVFLAALILFPPTLYVLVRRRAANPARVALIVLIAVGVVLAAIYLYWISFYVVFPADILIWSESDFVNDILKFRLGYPLYTAQVNNESFTYVPGPQLLTYFLAWLSGNPTSIPIYRAIQVGYTLLAAFIAMLGVRKLLELGMPTRRPVDWRLWSAAWLPVLFLIATNSLTNPFVYNLHDDALAQLFNVLAFFVLLSYVSSHDKRLLAVMALLPGIGFLVKQSIIVWAVLYSVQLALFERPFSLRRLSLFALVSFGTIGAVIGASYLLWGDPFVYWIFTVLGKHAVSPLRSFQHLLDVWIYFGLGLFAGLVLLRGKSFRVLLGPWIIWLGLMFSETYTSGIAYMVNHIGPGCLVAGVWAVAALTRVWKMLFPNINKGRCLEGGLRAASTLGVVGLVFSGLNLIRIPLSPLPQDAYRYIADIEQQFSGQSTSSILLDVGTWVYVKDGVIMKDRAPTIGERGYSETGDFSGIIQRLQQKRYSKILVRDLNAPDFWYDYGSWQKSSGIRQAMLDNYHVVGTIPAMHMDGYEPDLGYPFGEVSILVPNSN